MDLEEEPSECAAHFVDRASLVGVLGRERDVIPQTTDESLWRSAPGWSPDVMLSTGIAWASV